MRDCVLSGGFSGGRPGAADSRDFPSRGAARALICLDRSLHCIAIGEGVTDGLLGVPKRELLGKRITALLREDQADAILETLARVISICRQLSHG